MSNPVHIPNYFEFYELPVQFHPDANAVRTKFYGNSKKYHPDFYANETDEKQQEVLELSTLNNKAYQALNDPAKRLKYVLELKGIVHTDEGYQLPQSFLMEMMEVNEALMDLEFDPDAAKQAELSEEVNQIEMQLQKDLENLTRDYDVNQNETSLAAIKDLYYRQKYIHRIRERLPKV